MFVVVVMQLYIVGKEIKTFFEQSRSVFVINVVFRSVVFFYRYEEPNAWRISRAFRRR